MQPTSSHHPEWFNLLFWFCYGKLLQHVIFILLSLLLHDITWEGSPASVCRAMRAEHARAAAQSRVRFHSRFINIECIAGPNCTRLDTALHCVPNNTSVKRDGDQMKGSQDVRKTDGQTCFIVRWRKSRYIFFGTVLIEVYHKQFEFFMFLEKTEQ